MAYFDNSSFSLFNKSKDIKRNIYRKFNYKLFEFNQNIRKYNSKFNLDKINNIYLNQNVNKERPLIIENYSKEKSNNKKSLSLKAETSKNKSKQLIIFNKPFPRANTNNYHNYLNMALIPLTFKKRKNNLLNQENYLSKNILKSKIKKFNLENKNGLLSDKNNFSNNISINNKVDNPEDDYSDCKSLKGIILSIKQNISENRYKLNKTFNEFDKQILQDQYLIERFYEMKKSIPNKMKINNFRKQLKEKNVNKNNDIIFRFNNNIYNNRKRKKNIK